MQLIRFSLASYAIAFIIYIVAGIFGKQLGYWGFLVWYILVALVFMATLILVIGIIVAIINAFKK